MFLFKIGILHTLLSRDTGPWSFIFTESHKHWKCRTECTLHPGPGRPGILLLRARQCIPAWGPGWEPFGTHRFRTLDLKGVLNGGSFSTTMHTLAIPVHRGRDRITLELTLGFCACLGIALTSRVRKVTHRPLVWHTEGVTYQGLIWHTGK